MRIGVKVKKDIFLKYGYETLVIWVDELQNNNREYLIQKLNTFVKSERCTEKHN